MSLKPQPPRAMPPETGRLGVKLLAADSPYRWVGEYLYERCREEDFADLYPAEGQPGLSPVDLAFVTAFQYLEGMSDRGAAEAARLRLDWKYALHWPLEYAGFNFSVLSEYRARLIAGGAEARVFEHLLNALRARGLLKPRGRQRTDSLAILTRARTLNRLELVVETLRVALRALLQADAPWTRATVPPIWEERYAARCVAERLSERERSELEREIGQDGQWLLDRLAAETTPEALSQLPAVQVLRTVWAQQYAVRESGECGGSGGSNRREVVWRQGGDYDGWTQIQSPHDPEARYSRKRDSEWIGDKLQVTETDDDDQPHLVTDIAMTSSVLVDPLALGEIQTRQAARGVSPAERFVDAGYVSGETLEESAKRGEDLVGPAPQDQSPQALLPSGDGLTLDQFQVDLEQHRVICPAGERAAKWMPRAKGGATVVFAPAVCATCPLRPRCCTGRGGRKLTLTAHYAALHAARVRQQTADFKQRYRQHRGGVEGCLSVLVRGHRIRVNWYIGRAKNHLRALFVGVAVNLRRAVRWLAGKRPQVRHPGLGLAG